MKLTKVLAQKAREYMVHQARPLEAALYAYEFENGSREKVLEELLKFQNEDGGFGHGLEPDFRLPDSSPLATTIAFQMMSRVSLDARHPMVQKGIRYFLNTYDEQKGRWIAVPEKVNDYPHAPWWHVSDEKGEGDWGNPTAEIVGYLHEYGELVSGDFLDNLTERAMDTLLSYPDEIEMHEILCFDRMASRLRSPEKEKVYEKLRRSISQVIGRSEKEWEEYSASPLTFIDSPESPYMDAVDSPLIEKTLDYLITKQTEDGSWAPNWSWFGNYEEDWPEAREEWKGVLTLNNLKVLREFKRME
ncbi:MAG: hypothetical protein H0Z32_11865 [Bacillaceae bacterium]|nr:hypothetical protein [Bacillaceae bacterium]